ncbi:hypothetical protein EJ03DRAFT_326826 [Teratosphaeria nubilosa]|uniref:Uncharacterized protein n=1 Tax=Teratosphaeria nubilosa TaxID=161662 RepID=A0A6G1LBF0_9PEZI|nr:hypothetical protein EJ03DRAFT_326826 [Teratosphaeria nubilosa]
MVEQVEEHTSVGVVDVGLMVKGSNNYGMPLELSDGCFLLARLARGDVNMPNFDGALLESQVRFDAATYTLL